MHDRLLTFLKACDRQEYFDLAGEALSFAIKCLTRETGIPPAISKIHGKGISALQRFQLGHNLTRTELRALAELEHALEQREQVPSSPLPGPWNLQDPVTFLAGVFPRLHLHRDNFTSGKQDPPHPPRGFITPPGIPPAGLYVLGVATSFAILTGLSAIPTAMAYGGHTWLMVLVPLLVVAFLACLLHWHT